MSPSDFPWWSWMAVAALFWFAQFIVDAYTDENAEESGWLIRDLMVVGAVLCTIIGFIRFVKWVWES